jgi:hypothetical protein
MKDKKQRISQDLDLFVKKVMAEIKPIRGSQADAVLRACLSLNSTAMLGYPKPF